MLFSPFYRKENEGLWGDAKRESWDGDLKGEQVVPNAGPLKLLHHE